MTKLSRVETIAAIRCLTRIKRILSVPMIIEWPANVVHVAKAAAGVGSRSYVLLLAMSVVGGNPPITRYNIAYELEVTNYSRY